MKWIALRPNAYILEVDAQDREEALSKACQVPLGEWDFVYGEVKCVPKKDDSSVLPLATPESGVRMFKVVVYKTVYDGITFGSDSVTLKRELLLPFPPFPGLTVEDGEWEDTITEVAWSVGKGIFECYTDSDRAVRKRSSEEISEVVAEYLEMGWQRRDGDDG